MKTLFTFLLVAIGMIAFGNVGQSGPPKILKENCSCIIPHYAVEFNANKTMLPAPTEMIIRNEAAVVKTKSKEVSVRHNPLKQDEGWLNIDSI